jgi:hypothetical protein
MDHDQLIKVDNIIYVIWELVYDLRISSYIMSYLSSCNVDN